MNITRAEAANINIFLDQICEIENSSFKTPWGRKDYLEQAELPFANIWCLTDENLVLSYCCFWVVIDEIHLLKIATKPSMRRNGYGNFMLTQLIKFSGNNKVSEIHLELRESNSIAYNFYKKFNFVEVGRRKNYYSKPREDALLMTYFCSENTSSILSQCILNSGGVHHGY